MTNTSAELISQELNNKNQIECDSISLAKIDNSISWTLGGRSSESLPFPENKNCETGSFSIEITINREGEVIETKFLPEISTELSGMFKFQLLITAENSKFSSNPKAKKAQK
jgi:hypothetical protein